MWLWQKTDDLGRRHVIQSRHQILNKSCFTFFCLIAWTVVVAQLAEWSLSNTRGLQFESSHLQKNL